MSKREEIFQKAFGQIPKEVCWNGFFNYSERPSKIKIIYLKLIKFLKFK